MTRPAVALSMYPGLEPHALRPEHLAALAADPDQRVRSGDRVGPITARPGVDPQDLAEQRVQVLGVAGRVADADPVQAIADQLPTFAAREVVLVTGPGIGPDEVDQVRRRLDRPVRLLAPTT